MADIARRKLLGRERQAVFHCSTRCVRRAFLFGRDPVTGKDFSHRRDWITCREEQLARLFAIEVEFRTEMINHLHAVLRSRPEIVAKWTPYDVARRWLTITKLAKCMSDDLPSPNEEKVLELADDKERIKKIRKRLTSISWFMGVLLENIARRANAEDECTGRFWETRFKCRECTDENSILLCGIYVDLNPIRAGEADCPENARYTSVFQRLMAETQPIDSPQRADGWMAELTLRPECKAEWELAYRSRSGRRASDLGILPMALVDYVKLLKWTAKLLQSGERTKIPHDLGAILEHLEVNAEKWVDTVENYEQTFGHAVGPPAALEQVAARLELHHLKGAPACRELFS